jgi:hypothetical protein
MTVTFAATLLLLLLPFLLSLAGQPGMPKVLCFVASGLAVLLSVEIYPAVLPWSLGMAIAVISVRERIYRRQISSFRSSRNGSAHRAARG